MADNRQLVIPGTNRQVPNSVLSGINLLKGNADLAVAIGIIGILALMVIPMPPFMLDMFLSLSITLAVLILMVSLYIRSPLEITIFPTILLVTTLFRLGLNVASTRLILSEAEGGDVITAFGTFVIGGNYVVGIIIFLILVVINFMVIIKGSGRIAEVSARFTLDALPGKQMSIDADLNAGFIDEESARKKRSDLNTESEFYGAMDGAAKFVRGDAIAGLIITAVNILAGFAIGALQKDMSIADALSTYTILTIGDGLVSQIPALLVSVAAGLVVTRSASGDNLDAEVQNQFTRNPKVLYVSAGAMSLFAFLPGFPVLPFMILATITGVLGYIRSQKIKSDAQDEMRRELAQAEESRKPEEKPIEDLLTVDPIELELGYSLIPLVDEVQGGDLFKRITNIRRQLATELGIVLPPVRVRDNLQLESEEYVFKMRGNELVRNKLYPGMVLAMNPGTAEGDMQGVRVTEPVFGLPATWITQPERENAEILGFTVVEPEAVLSTHLTELLRSHADKTLDRQAVHSLVEHLKKDYPTLAEEITNDTLPLSILHKVLQNLLKESIPIRDLPLIIESLLDYIQVTRNIDVLTEYVRHSLSDTIKRLYADDRGVVHAIGLDSRLESTMNEALQNNQSSSPTLGLSGGVLQQLKASLSEAMDEIVMAGYNPVIVTSATVRPYLYRMIHTTFPSIHVVSFTELPGDTDIEFLARVAVEELQPA